MTAYIRYAASIDSMEGATDTQRAAFLAQATAALQARYPKGDIELTEARHYGGSPIEYEGCDPSEVRQIINRVWNDGEWMAA